MLDYGIRAIQLWKLYAKEMTDLPLNNILESYPPKRK